jgi:histidine triad (HIT) family protein
MPETDCIFCKIAQHQIPVKAVHEDEHSICFADINAQAPTHLLLIPKEHYTNAAAAPAEVLGHLLKQAATLGEGLLPQGFRLVVNTGDNGGQTVHHLHLHILGGRPMHWPLG